MMYDVNVRTLCQDYYYSKYMCYTYVLSFHLIENKLSSFRLTKELENNQCYFKIIKRYT